MKYIFYTFLIYWIYNKFFASPPIPPRENPNSRNNNYENFRSNVSKKETKDEGEFIDYEEIK